MRDKLAELAEMPLQTRAAEARSVDAEARTVDVVFSSGATVRRARWVGWDTRIPFDEVLVVTEAAVNLTRLNAGGPVVDSHATYSTGSQLAVVERAWIEGGQGLARVRFPKAGIDESADRLFGKVADGIVRNVSVGYSLDKVRVVEPQTRDQVEQRIVERWTPFEISFVTVPADAGAQVRGEDTAARTFPIEIERPPRAPDGAAAAAARMRMRAAAAAL